MATSRRVAWTAIALLACTVHAAATGVRQNSFVDQSGARFTLERMRGTPVVVTFIAARCTDACPLINAQISAAAHDPRAVRQNVRFLTLTLDPDHDTPVIMRHIASAFDARAPRWMVASADAPAIHAVMRRFGVVATKSSNGVPEVHTTFVYILDKNERLREALLASPDLPAQVFAAIARL